MRIPKHSTLVAYAALFIALGGTSLAASRYIITSTSQIKPSVRHALTRDRVARGPQGPQGPQGIPGPQGLQGSQGPAGQAASVPQPFFYTRHSVTDVLGTSDAVVQVYCDPTDRIVSGGYGGDNEVVTEDRPLSGNPVTPWEVTAHLEQGAASGSVVAWVLCERN